jgi:EAL domain-containing protein (putative c-di-GMP-specific phosphodiesterase class I)
MQASLLELEIHESLLIHDVEKTLKILTALKALGVKIAIDDFGAGFLSLSGLQRFPLDTIKIGRSFIREVATASEYGALAEAIISMCNNLSLKVVAQGVETKEQAEFLREHACDELQGFYFNRPVSAQQFTKLLQAQAADTTHVAARAY